jgi:hypothetical protein
MARTEGAPSHNRYSYFRCEEGVITDVNRKTFTVRVDTRHSGKTVEDIQVMSPYHHFSSGEGIHHLPEVGAICLIAFPSDNTPPFIMGYLGAASTLQTLNEEEGPERSTAAAEGSATDVSFRSRRPQLNPGDIAITTRDENFLILKRGGVLQIGSTPLSQRIYIPVLNYIKDFAENYELSTFGGDVSWTVARQEDDPSGDAPASYVFHVNEFAQDAKASVRVSHFPLAAPGGTKTAWQVHIAPKGIDRDTGEVENEVYSLIITTDGTKTEVIGADRTVTVTGNDVLDVDGDQTVRVKGNVELRSDRGIKQIASRVHVIGGSQVKLASESASNPAVKGRELVQLLSSAVWPVTVVGGAMVASPSPAWIQALQRILSQKVLLE